MTLAVVIGLGEVGRPLYNMLVNIHGANKVKGRDLDTARWENYTFDFMHVCFPQTVDFIKQVSGYVEDYAPKCIIIHSTLSPGMTEHLDDLFNYPDIRLAIFYSPVRGNEKDGMMWCLQHYTKFIAPGGRTRVSFSDALDATTKHLESAGMKVEYTTFATALEYAKLLDLCWYGLNIAFYQELERILEEKHIVDPLAPSSNIVKKFIASTPVESEGKVPRHVFYGGFIGGHCVIPAIRKILALHDIPMLQAVLDSNLKREVELTLPRPE